MHHCLLYKSLSFSHRPALRFLKIQILLRQSGVLIELLIIFRFYWLVHVVFFIIVLAVLAWSWLNARVTRVLRLVLLIHLLHFGRFTKESQLLRRAVVWCVLECFTIRTSRLDLCCWIWIRICIYGSPEQHVELMLISHCLRILWRISIVERRGYLNILIIFWVRVNAIIFNLSELLFLFLCFIWPLLNNWQGSVFRAIGWRINILLRKLTSTSYSKNLRKNFLLHFHLLLFLHFFFLLL